MNMSHREPVTDKSKRLARKIAKRLKAEKEIVQGIRKALKLDSQFMKAGAMANHIRQTSRLPEADR